MGVPLLVITYLVATGSCFAFRAHPTISPRWAAKCCIPCIREEDEDEEEEEEEEEDGEGVKECSMALHPAERSARSGSILSKCRSH